MVRKAKTRGLINIMEGGKYCKDLYLRGQEFRSGNIEKALKKFGSLGRKFVFRCGKRQWGFLGSKRCGKKKFSGRMAALIYRAYEFESLVSVMQNDPFSYFLEIDIMN